MKPGNIIYKGKTRRGNEIIIRYIQEGDHYQMTDYINTLSQEKTFIRFQGEVITLDEEYGYLEKQLELLEKNEVVNLLVIHDEKIIGVANINMEERIHNHIGLLGLSIKKEFRSEGIGSQLLDQMIKESKKNIPQLRVIHLGVFANNPIAISLYKKFGFIQYGILPEGVFYKGEYVDYYYMYKNIISWPHF